MEAGWGPLLDPCPSTCMGSTPCLGCFKSLMLLLEIFINRTGLPAETVAARLPISTWVVWKVCTSRNAGGSSSAPKSSPFDVIRTMTMVDNTPAWHHAISANIPRPYLMCQLCEVRPRLLQSNLDTYEYCWKCEELPKVDVVMPNDGADMDESDVDMLSKTPYTSLVNSALYPDIEAPPCALYFSRSWLAHANGSKPTALTVGHTAIDATRYSHDGCPSVLGAICECSQLQGQAPQTMTTFGWCRRAGGWACPFHANDFTQPIPPAFTTCGRCSEDARQYANLLRQGERPLRAFIDHQDIARVRVVNADDVMHLLRTRPGQRIQTVSAHYRGDDKDMLVLRAPITTPGNDTVCHAS